MSKMFNIAHDLELVAKGSHFWCSCCCVAVSIEEQSVNKNYCVKCLANMKESKLYARHIKEVI